MPPRKISPEDLVWFAFAAAIAAVILAYTAHYIWSNWERW